MFISQSHIFMAGLCQALKEDEIYAWELHMKIVKHLCDNDGFDVDLAHTSAAQCMNSLFGLDTTLLIKQNAPQDVKSCFHIWSDGKKNTIQSCILCGQIKGED